MTAIFSLNIHRSLFPSTGGVAAGRGGLHG